ncbi:MAG: hypothetical protein ABIQ89_04405 [Candidatus Saccharimonadales bacterium]
MALFLLPVLCCLLLIAPTHTRAAKAEGIQVKPLRSYPTLDRGSTGKGTLTLTNKTPTLQNISMSVETFGVSGGENNYDYSFGTSEEVNWVVFNEPKIALQPGQSHDVTYSVAVPGDASAGGHYFSLLTTIDPPKGSGGVTEIRRVASLLYLEVSGSITKKSSLVDFSLPFFTTKPVVPTEVHISNNGTSHTRARVGVTGQLLRAKIFRQPKQEYTLMEGTVMPATVRKLTGEVHLSNGPGIYKIGATYAPHQGGTQVVNRTVIYAPVWFLALILATLSGITITLVRYIKSRKA